MHLRRQWQCHRRLLIALIVSLLSNACARKNRETPMPSMAPSISVAPSYSPSAMPSFQPSLAPSSTPSTSPPSSSPSQDPTGQPTPSPSSAPTSEPTPSPSSAPSTSEAPTTSPTSPTTPSPSSAPSTSETPTTEEENLVSVPMPEIGITFFLDDNDASSSSFLNLATEVTKFLQYVLSARLAENFGYISLDYDVSQFAAAAERRRLKTGVSVEIEGLALYAVDTELPTTEDIAELLKGYFSFWGIQDLEDHLHATGLPSTQDIQVYIDQSIVEVVTNEEDPDGEDTDQVRGSFQSQGDNDGPPLETGGIVGVVVGSVVFIIAVSLAAFHGQKKRRKRRNSPSEVPVSSAAAARAGRIGATPLPGADYASSSEAMSIDDSLYTTDESIILSTTGVISQNSYDAKRLDRVIAAAKESTADGKSSFI